MPLPIAAAAAANPELVNKAASGIGKAVKVIGIAIGVGLATFVIVKVVKKGKEIKKEKDELEKITKQKETDGEATLEQPDLIAMANALYTAFNQDALVVCTYDDDAIIKTLSKLQTVTDWKNLCTVFGTRPATKSDGGKDHNLVWYLGSNNANHKADYQAELTRIGLPNALGTLNGRKRKRKKRRGFFKKLLNPLTPFKATKNATKAVRNAVKKKGIKALFNPKTGIKVAKNSL